MSSNLAGSECFGEVANECCPETEAHPEQVDD